MIPQLEINPSLSNFNENVTKCHQQIHKMFNIHDSNTEACCEDIGLLDVARQVLQRQNSSNVKLCLPLIRKVRITDT